MRRAVSRVLPAVAALAVLGSTAACEEFATPSDLDRAQIIAIIAEPPMVEPGGAATLTVVLAGPDGLVAPDAVRWTVQGLPGEPPQGSIEVDDGGVARYVAPAAVAESPTAAPLEAEVEIDGRTLLASKLVGIGDLGLTNPAMTALTVAGAAVVDDAPAAVARGATVEVAAVVEPAPSEDAGWSWYSTAGEIERYRSNPTELVVDDEVGPAWLIAVIRDGGGQAVRAVPLVVE